MKHFDLSGRTAIVTGSTRGIGRAIAEILARAGAKVVVSSRKAEACEAVVAAIAKDGGTAIAVPCNVGYKDQLATLVAETRRQFGTIDILICNAAVNPYYGPLAEIPDEAYDRTMNSNATSRSNGASTISASTASPPGWSRPTSPARSGRIRRSSSAAWRQRRSAASASPRTSPASPSSSPRRPPASSPDRSSSPMAA